MQRDHDHSTEAATPRRWLEVIVLLLLPISAGCGPRAEVPGTVVVSGPDRKETHVAPKKPPEEATRTTPIAQRLPPTERDRPLALDDKLEGGNLLLLPSAKVAWSSAPAAEAAGLKEMVDGNPNSVGELAVAPDAPLEVVFGFEGATVTPQRLILLLPRQSVAGGGLGRIEILVSTTSPHAGFQSVRADPVRPETRIQEFAFQPIAARWIMLRFTPAAKTSRVAVAEVAVLGREGLPTSHYAFKESPAKALDLLARLRKISALNVAISSDEADLFEDARDGKLDKWSFGEAALLASGIQDKEKRKAYMDRLTALEAESKSTLSGAQSTYEKGERLLKWLHSNPLAKGYVSGQTDMSVILDSRTFNCVSSATIYNVLGRRLEMDLRAIEVPDHAFSILYDGTNHADVETTTPHGFNPARDKTAQEELKKMTGFVYIPDSHRDRRREISEVGLLAIIYYNHGVELTHAKRYHEALLAYFRAMSLDPEFASAVKNALATLALWSIDLARTSKFDEALQVVATGLELAPRDATLLHGRKAIWTEWAFSHLKTGNDTDALAVLERAAVAVPAETVHFQKMRVFVYILPGEGHIKAGDFDKALTVADRGLTKLEGASRVELQDWRVGVLLRWAHRELDGRKFDEALAVLDRAQKLDPNEKRFAHQIAYAIQEWTRDVYAKQGEEKAQETLAKLLERYTDVPAARHAVTAYVHSVVEELSRQGKDADANAFIERHAAMLNDKSEGHTLVLFVCDRHAQRHMANKEWEAAAKVYEVALQKFPKDEHLTNSLLYLLQEWVKTTHAAHGPEQAQELLASLLKRFKHELGDAKSMEDFVRRLVRQHAEKGNFAEAIAALEQHSGSFPDQAKVRERMASLYDEWGRRLLDAKDWEGAVAVYEAGLQRFGDTGQLKHNFIVAVQDGTWGTYLQEGEEPARLFFARLLERYPANESIVDRLHYHIQQVSRKLMEAGQYEEALLSIDRHAALLSDPSKLKSHYHHLYDDWADAEAKAGRPDAAVNIYARGLQHLNGDGHLKANLVAGVQKWAWTAYESGGEAKAQTFLAGVVQKFPHDKEIQGRIVYHVQQVARKLNKDGSHDEALAAVARHQMLLGDDALAAPIIRMVYDSWADSFVITEPKNWEAAVNKYMDGVKKYPANKELRHNAAVMWDRWARTYFDKDWTKAIAIYDKGLAVLPNESLLKDNKAYCERKQKK